MIVYTSISKKIYKNSLETSNVILPSRWKRVSWKVITFLISMVHKVIIIMDDFLHSLLWCLLYLPTGLPTVTLQSNQVSSVKPQGVKVIWKTKKILLLCIVGWKLSRSTFIPIFWNFHVTLPYEVTSFFCFHVMHAIMLIWWLYSWRILFF